MRVWRCAIADTARIIAVVAAMVVMSTCSSADPGSSQESVHSTVETTEGLASSTSVAVDLAELATRSGNGDPTEVILPVAPDNAAREWLDGDGASAARLVSVTEPLWSVGASACAEVAAELDALGSPEELLAASSATPDPVTSELLIALHAATGRALTACLDEDEFARAVNDFAWQWALADRRLDELGVTR